MPKTTSRVSESTVALDGHAGAAERERDRAVAVGHPGDDSGHRRDERETGPGKRRADLYHGRRPVRYSALVCLRLRTGVHTKF